MHCNIYVRNRTELNTNKYRDFPCLSKEAELQCWNDNLLLSYIVQSSAKSHQKTYLKFTVKMIEEVFPTVLVLVSSLK